MVNFRVSDVAPNHAETTYWVDLSDNRYKGVIKYYDANSKTWKPINDITNSSQDKAIKELVSAIAAIQGSVSTLERGKVDKVNGKQLSTNDYTTDEKNKLAGIAAQANKTNIVNNLTTSAAGSALDAQQGKVLKDALDALTQRVTALETPAA